MADEEDRKPAPAPTPAAAPATVDAPGTENKLTGTVKSPLDADIAKTTAAPKPPTAPPAALAIDDLMKQESELSGAYRKNLEKKNAELEALKPNLQPFSQKMPEVDPARAFGSWASVLGVLAGSLTRQPLTAALNASGMAMQAIRANDIKGYEDAKQTWKENTDLAIKNAEWSYKQYQAGLDLMKTNYDAGAAHIKTTAALIGDKHTMQNDDIRTAAAAAQATQQIVLNGMKIAEAQENHLAAMHEGVLLYEKQRANNPNLPTFSSLRPEQQMVYYSQGATSLRIAETLGKSAASAAAQKNLWANQGAAAAFFAKYGRLPDMSNPSDANIMGGLSLAALSGKGAGATTELSPEALDDAAMKYAMTGSMVPTGYGSAAASIKTQVANRAAELAKLAGVTPQELAAMPAEKKADASSLMAMTKFYDGVQRSEQALDSGFEIAAKLREKLSFTSIQKVNAAYLDAQRETGDPEANAYLNQMYTLGMEYGRLVMGAASIAMLPVSGAEAAQKRFTAALSEGQFDAERKQVKAEAETWRTAAQNVMNDRLASLRSFGRPGSTPAAPVAAPVAAPAAAPALAPAAAPVPPARAPAAVGPVNAAEQEESLANLRAALKKYPERRDDILAYARMTGVSLPGDL